MKLLSVAGKSLSVAEIAKHLSARVEGDDKAKVNAIKPLHEAYATDLSFFAPTSKKQHAELLKVAASSKAAAILTHKKYEEIGTTQLVVDNPLEALIAISGLLYQKPKPELGVHPSSVVDKSAELGSGVRIGPFCFVGKNVKLGENAIIHPQVTIYDGVNIGKNCVIHAGAVIREEVQIKDNCVIQAGVVIGGDGFGYISTREGHLHIPHIGNVEIGEHVEIGSNSTIDRATLGKTSIGSGTKIDNLVMIGHNVQIGAGCLLCGQVGVSGSSSLGDYVVLGGQVGVADHLKVGSHVRAAGKAGIVTSIGENQEVAGHPAIAAQDWRKAVSIFKKLPELYRALKNKDL